MCLRSQNVKMPWIYAGTFGTKNERTPRSMSGNKFEFRYQIRAAHTFIRDISVAMFVAAAAFTHVG